MEAFKTVILIINIFSSLAIIGLVLMQHGKGADAGASFGGSGSAQGVFGSGGNANFLTRMTAIAASIFFASCLALGYIHSNNHKSELDFKGVQQSTVSSKVQTASASASAEPVATTNAATATASASSASASSMDGQKMATAAVATAAATATAKATAQTGSTKQTEKIAEKVVAKEKTKKTESSSESKKNSKDKKKKVESKATAKEKNTKH